MMIDIARGWLIDLPDFTSVEWKDEDILSYSNNDEGTELQISIYDIVDMKGTDKEELEHLPVKKEALFPSECVAVETLYDDNTYTAGKAIIYHGRNIQKQTEFWVLDGVKIKGDQYVVAMIYYPTEDYKQTAIETWRSITKLSEN